MSSTADKFDQLEAEVLRRELSNATFEDFSGFKETPKLRELMDFDGPTLTVFVPHTHLMETWAARSLMLKGLCEACHHDNHVVVIGSERAKQIREWVDNCIPREGEGKSRGEFIELWNGSRVWVVEPHRLHDLPIDFAHDVIVENAETCEPSMGETCRLLASKHGAQGGRVRFVSHAVTERHWLAELDPTRTFTLTDACDIGEFDRSLAPESPSELDLAAYWAERLPTITSCPEFAGWAKDRLWVRTKAGKLDPFALNTPQMIFEGECERARARAKTRGLNQTLIVVIKSRRLGISTYIQGKYYQRSVIVPESRCLTLAQTDADTRTLFEITQRFLREDRHAPPTPPAGNATILRFPSLNSKYSVVTAGARAPKRGDTLDHVHGSETAFWCNRDKEKVEALWNGLLEAASHGEVIAESSPNGMEWTAETFIAAQEGQNDWYPIFMPWFIDPTNRLTVADPASILDTLSDEENDIVAAASLDVEQLAWRRAQLRKLRIWFYQEYPEDPRRCFLATGTAYFTLAVVEKRMRQLASIAGLKQESVRVGKVDDTARMGGRGYKVVRKRPEAGRRYVIGADTSEGLEGCDPCGFYVLDRETGEDVMWVHGIFRPKALATLIVAAAKEYNDAYTGIELNNHGHAVVQAVIDLGYHQTWKLHHGENGKPGFETTNSSRPAMLDDCATFVDEHPELCFDAAFLDECRWFKLQEDQTFGADPGKHDDRIMARSIALAMRRFRKYLPTIGVHGPVSNAA